MERIEARLLWEGKAPKCTRACGIVLQGKACSSHFWRCDHHFTSNLQSDVMYLQEGVRVEVQYRRNHQHVILY